MSEDQGFLIAGSQQVSGLLGRLARSILAATDGKLYLVGVRRRGVPLMERIMEHMEQNTDRTVSSGELVLKRYADDLSVLHDQPELKEDPELQVDGKSVVVVDDVLYTGRTMWKAVNIVREMGATRVRTASLCSRGNNEVPVEGQFVGLHLDVCEENVIKVHVPPYEESTGIVLFHEEDVSA